MKYIPWDKINKEIATSLENFNENQLESLIKLNDNISKITVWSRFNKDKFEHNHIEVDWKENNKPIPKFKAQNCWNKYEWKKEFGWLINGKVII